MVWISRQLGFRSVGPEYQFRCLTCETSTRARWVFSGSWVKTDVQDFSLRLDLFQRYFVDERSSGSKMIVMNMVSNSSL